MLPGLKKQIKLNFSAVVLLLAFFTSGCADLFQFSPFDAKTSDSALNEKNIQKIKNLPHTNSDTLHIAVFADSHNYYKDLNDAVSAINSNPNIDFVIVAGDITEKGLALEYEWFLDDMQKLNKPFITTIGNHDYRSNGGVVYKKLFGPTNFFFDYRDYRFIGFDNTVWENNNTPPDFTWLNNVSLLTDSSRFPILIAHVLPGAADQSSDLYTPMYEAIAEKSRTLLSIHGHVHEYHYTEKNGVHYLVAGSVYYRHLTVVHLYKNTVTVERIPF